MPKEYISREAAIAVIGEIQGGRRTPDREYYDAICSIPAADVAEVVHAEWVNNVCTKCKKVCSTLYYNNTPTHHFLTPYCPNCGAKMDGGEKNAD